MKHKSSQSALMAVKTLQTEDTEGCMILSPIEKENQSKLANQRSQLILGGGVAGSQHRCAKPQSNSMVIQQPNAPNKVTIHLASSKPGKPQTSPLRQPLVVLSHKDSYGKGHQLTLNQFKLCSDEMRKFSRQFQTSHPLQVQGAKSQLDVRLAGMVPVQVQEQSRGLNKSSSSHKHRTYGRITLRPRTREPSFQVPKEPGVVVQKVKLWNSLEHPHSRGQSKENLRYSACAQDDHGGVGHQDMSRVELSPPETEEDDMDDDEMMQNTDEAGGAAGAHLSCSEMFSIRGNCCGGTATYGDASTSSANFKKIQGGAGIYGSIGSGSELRESQNNIHLIPKNENKILKDYLSQTDLQQSGQPLKNKNYKQNLQQNTMTSRLSLNQHQGLQPTFQSQAPSSLGVTFPTCESACQQVSGRDTCTKTPLTNIILQNSGFHGGSGKLASLYGQHSQVPQSALQKSRKKQSMFNMRMLRPETETPKASVNLNHTQLLKPHHFLDLTGATSNLAHKKQLLNQTAQLSRTNSQTAVSKPTLPASFHSRTTQQKSPVNLPPTTTTLNDYYRATQQTQSKQNLIIVSETQYGTQSRRQLSFTSKKRGSQDSSQNRSLSKGKVAVTGSNRTQQQAEMVIRSMLQGGVVPSRSRVQLGLVPTGDKGALTGLSNRSLKKTQTFNQTTARPKQVAVMTQKAKAQLPARYEPVNKYKSTVYSQFQKTKQAINSSTLYRRENPPRAQSQDIFLGLMYLLSSKFFLRYQLQRQSHLRQAFHVLKQAATQDSPHSQDFEEDPHQYYQSSMPHHHRRLTTCKPITEVDEDAAPTTDHSMMKQRSKVSLNQLMEGITAEYEKDSEVREKLDRVIDLLSSIKSHNKVLH